MSKGRKKFGNLNLVREHPTSQSIFKRMREPLLLLLQASPASQAVQAGGCFQAIQVCN